MDRFFGGNPLMVLLKLAVLSLIVGVVLAALGLDALSLLDGFRLALVRLYNMGFGAVRWLVDYFLIGAAVVVPIWLVARLIKTMGRRSDPKS